MKIIESITIRYFRSVYTVSLNPCNDITILAGKNDAGKSNILKALNLFFCQQTDYQTVLNFSEDYSLTRKEEVRKDTIRGQQFISISVRFLRGDRMPNSLPPTFSVTKKWDMHSPEAKVSSDVQARMEVYAKKQGIKHSERITSSSLSAFLNKIKYIYIPAIKDEKVFNNTLNILQSSIFESKNKLVLDEPINKANVAIQEIIGDLQTDFKQATGITNLVQLPNTLNYTGGLLQIDTTISDGIISIDKRGDGIRTHYIPKILNYVASKSNQIYIWGFEEPENSYEYRRCIQVAEEFEKEYSKNSQIFITSHSPAFLNSDSDNKKIFRIGRDGDKTVLLKESIALDEELGYIDLYRDFIDKIKRLQNQNQLQKGEIDGLKNEINNIQTPLILTEGKTDSSLLKLAIKKLGLHEYENWEIKQITSGKTHNNDALLSFLKELRDNSNVNSLVIGMFDRDAKLELINNNRKIDIRDYDYYKLAPKIYAFAIPVPHNRQEQDQISIEHYFTDDEIKTDYNGKRLFLANEFYPTGVFIGKQDFCYRASAELFNTIKIIERETKKYVTNVRGDVIYSISKAKFVEYIEEEKEGFKDISFSEFKKIFNVVKRIQDDNDK